MEKKIKQFSSAVRNGGSVNILDEPVTESGYPLRHLRTLCQDNGCQRELSLHSIVQQQMAVSRRIVQTYNCNLWITSVS